MANEIARSHQDVSDSKYEKHLKSSYNPDDPNQGAHNLNNATISISMDTAKPIKPFRAHSESQELAAMEHSPNFEVLSIESRNKSDDGSDMDYCVQL